MSWTKIDGRNVWQSPSVEDVLEVIDLFSPAFWRGVARQIVEQIPNRADQVKFRDTVLASEELSNRYVKSATERQTLVEEFLRNEL